MARLSTIACSLSLLLVAPLPVIAQTGIPGYGQRPPLREIGELPVDWEPGQFDRETGTWLPEKSRNIKWVAKLGSVSFGSPVVAGGRVFVGTNNGNGYLSRYPDTTDLGCLLCFREADGEFLWQHSSEKLPTGRAHDLVMQGIQSSPWVEGERAWFVNNRGEVICLDPQGFSDGEDDGEPFEESSVLAIRDEELAAAIASLDQQERIDLIERFIKEHWASEADDFRTEVVRAGQKWRVGFGAKQGAQSFILTPDFWGLRIARENAQPGPHEADVVWRLNMMERFGSQQHGNSICCVCVWKETLFVCTGNGVDQSCTKLPAPEAPSFVALDKTTGKVLWTSNLPGGNIFHGNWSSPVAGVLGGVPQVIFNGGDGWTYSFHAEQWRDGQPQLLWKFDTNEKDAKFIIGGAGTRNEPIAPPVLHDGRVFIATGQDAEHGEGPGCLWCIDPTKRGDVSAELVGKPDIVMRNPNSAVIWKYVGFDQNADGELAFEEQMHRTIAPVAIDGDLLFASDFSGLLHCLDVKTGQAHWTYDRLAASWSPPFVAVGKVYAADEDGDITIFYARKEPAAAGGKTGKLPAGAPGEPLRTINMSNSCFTLPTASKGVLFIANKTHLYAIQAQP